MATFTVTTLNDENDGGSGGTGLSLREAIDLANADSAADVIEFTVTGEIDLTTMGTLSITEALSIVGNGITLDGGGTTQIINASASLSIDGLTFTGGNSGGGGGAIGTSASLTVANAVFEDNEAIEGGAIYCYYSSLDVTSSTFSGNSALGSGGAIYASGDIDIASSTFTNNSSPSGYGGAVLSYAGAVSVESSTFEGNTATQGGAVLSNGAISVDSSTFEGNTATQYGGALLGNISEVTSSTFANNSAVYDGGAIASTAGITAQNTTFYGNQASNGGAIWTMSSITLADVTATANSTTMYGQIVFYSATGIYTASNSILVGNTGQILGLTTFAGPTILDYGSGLTPDPNVIEVAGVADVFQLTITGDPDLANNGGPVKTIALNLDPSNPALDAGGLATDARGESAFDISGLGTAAGDLGAYEYVGASVVNVDATSANGTYWFGQTIDITVEFDQAVLVSGTPMLQLETGSTDRQASYVSGSGSDTLTFRYTVQAGDTAADLNFLSTSALSLNGGTILDANSLGAAIALPATGSAQSLAAQAAIQVNGIAAPAAPVLAVALADQAAAEDATFNFAVPSGAFTDVNGDTLTYAATLANGSALPSWLSFNATTRTFSGTPLNANVGAISVKVTASDGTNIASDEFTITVANTNDAPTAVALSANTVAENSAAGTVISSVSVTDPDTGDTSTLSLIGTAGGRFALSGNQLVVAEGGTLDFEDKQSYSIIIRATDAAGATKDQTLTIDLTDIDDSVIGGKGNNTLVGGAGDELLDGKAGNDRLTGGDGADTFKFGKGYGRDTITDFDPAEGDIVDLSGAVGIKNFKDLIKHHVEDTGNDLVITADDGSVLVLKGVDVDDLSKDCFLF